MSSVGLVRDKTLPGTTDGMEHVCICRHALALDERRVKFAPEYVCGGDGPGALSSGEASAAGSAPAGSYSLYHTHGL